MWKYDFRGSAGAGVDRLFQAGRFNRLDDTTLPEAEREQFFLAWDKATGVPLLDVTATGYPPIDVTARDLASLMALPAGVTPRTWSVTFRAIQVIE